MNNTTAEAKAAEVALKKAEGDVAQAFLELFLQLSPSVRNIVRHQLNTKYKSGSTREES